MEELIYKTAGVADNLDLGFLEKIHNHAPGVIVGHLSTLLKNQRLREIYEKVLETPIKTFNKPEEVQLEGGSPLKWQGGYGVSHGGSMIFINPAIRPTDIVRTLFEEGAHAIWGAEGRLSKPFDPAHPPTEEEYLSDPEEIFAKRTADYAFAIATGKIKTAARMRLSPQIMKGGQSFLWAIVNDRVIFSTEIWPHAHWFESIGLAGSGPEFDRIPRGRVWVKPEQDEVIIITEAALGGLMGRGDFTFAPEYVVEAILQTFPQLRDFNIVDDIPSYLVTASTVPKKGTLDPKKGTVVVNDFLRGYTLLWAIWEGKVMLSQYDQTHADWFSNLGIPNRGSEFDHIPRGRAVLEPAYHRVLLITDAGRSLTGIAGKLDFDFTPQHVVDAIKKIFPETRKLEFVDDVTPDILRAKTGASQRWSNPLLNGLKAEARKAPTFEDFKHDFSLDIKHGLYFHVTDNPNFTIDPAKGPRDMSSMGGGTPTPGKLMVTSHLENWTDYYENDRAYVAVIDMSEVPRESYHQVSRGFGNEFWVEAPQYAKVAAVMPVKEAIKLDRTYQNILDLHSDEDLLEFYNQFHAPAADEWKPPKEQGRLPFRGKGIAVASQETNKATNPKSIIEMAEHRFPDMIKGQKYEGARAKYRFTCSKHGEYEQALYHHNEGYGCDKCGGGATLTIKEVEQRFSDMVKGQQWLGNHAKYRFLCDKHGEYEQRFNSHSEGRGCPRCAGNKRLTIEEALQRCPDMVEGQEWGGIRAKYWFVCDKHGKYEQTFINHYYNKQRCPVCDQSRGELVVASSLKDMGFKFSREVSFSGLRDKLPLHFDFYLFDHRILIEFHGIQHYQPVLFGRRMGQKDVETVFLAQQKADKIKETWAETNGYTLIVVPYTVKPQDISEYLNEKLKILLNLEQGNRSDSSDKLAGTETNPHSVPARPGWSYEEPLSDGRVDFFENVENPHSERPLTAALSPVYTEEVKKLEYEHELISLAEEMGNFERVVWERQPVLKTHTLDIVGLVDSAKEYPHLRAVHVGDPDYWFNRLAEDFGRESKAWVVEIYPTEDDYLCDDVQYAMDPSGGNKAYSAILITPRTQLVEGKDFRYVKELTEEDLPEVYEEEGYGWEKDAAKVADRFVDILWVLFNGGVYTSVKIGNKTHDQIMEEYNIPFSGPSYDKVVRGIAEVDRQAHMIRFRKSGGGFTPNEVVEHVLSKYNLKGWKTRDEMDDPTFYMASSKQATSEDDYYNAAEAFFEREEVVATEIINEYMQHVRQKKYRQQWNVVPAARLIKIWEDYMKTGFVRDSAGLSQIAETIIDNALKIYINSILCGHSQMNPEEYAKDIMERNGIVKKFPAEYFERAPDFFDTPEGDWRLSDQSDRLINLAQGVFLAKSDEDKLQALDKVLQFSHPRSDLSSWLVQGGRTTLNRLFTGMNEYERWEQYGGVEEAKEFNRGRNALLIPKEAWSTEPGGVPLKPETQPLIAEMVADIRKIYPECQRISLAGSSAREELKPKSDIDVVIDFPKGIPAWDMVERDQPLWDKYQQVEGRMVDFIIHIEGGPHVGQYDYREGLGLPNPMRTLWEDTTKTAATAPAIPPDELLVIAEAACDRTYRTGRGPDGSCQEVSELIEEEINRRYHLSGDAEAFTYWGTYRGHPHAWVIVGDQWVDATSDQFDVIREEGEEEPAIQVGKTTDPNYKCHYASKTAARRPKYRTYAPDTRTFSDTFMKWFDGSKAVDAYGKPLLVYHGSPDTRFLKEEGVFQTPTERFLHKEDPERAFWFAADYSTASSYADPHRAWDYQGCEPGTKGFYLSIKNPYMVNKGGQSWHGTDTTIAEAKAGGHDGIIIHNTVDTYQAKGQKTDTYAVFSPNQIKAVDNTVCDPVSPNVNASKTSAQRSIWYHGSSINNLRSILTEGLNPRPKNRNWGDDPDASAYAPSRASYGGIYVTQNLTTAMSAPRQRGKEHGVVLVCMELQPNTMYLDEDSVTGYLQQALPSISDMGNSYYILPAYLAAAYPDRAKGWGEYVDSERNKYVSKAMRGLRYKWYGTGNDEFNGDFHPEVQKRLLEILPGCFFAALARSAAHHAKKEQDWEINRTYQRAFEAESRETGTPSAEEIRKLFPSPEEGEKVFRDAVAKVTIALKRYANPKKPNEVYNFNTARIETPIGYNGSNRILAVIEVREKYHLKKVEDKQLPTELAVYYGEIPPDFFAQFNARYGENYIVKQAETLGKTAGDDSNAFDPDYYMTEGCGIFAVALARLNQGVVYFMSDPEGDPWHNIGEMSPQQIEALEDSGSLIDWNMTHVYCMAPDGKTYDIKGQRSPAVMAKDFDMDPANPEVSLDGGPYQPDDFMNQFMGEMPEYAGEGERPLYGNEADVVEVTQYILKNPRKYGLTRKGR